MPPSKRWCKPRKQRKKETAPRKPRKAETKPRKARVTKLVPIAAKGDIKGLAAQRKKCSKTLLKKRLVKLTFEELGEYAEEARVCIRQAQRHRGKKLHKGWLTEEEKEKVLEEWEEMVETLSGKKGTHSLCTIPELRKRMEAKGITIGKTAAQNLTAHIKKKPRPVYVHHNQPEYNERKKNRDRT